MTPSALNPDAVLRRLRLMRDALDTLHEFRGVDAARLSDEPVTRAAIERLLQVIVDLAFDINSNLVSKTLGRSPETGRSSFSDLAEAGVIAATLADSLAPSAGLRNVLVHHYVDLDLELVTIAIGTVCDSFPAYIKAVSRYLDSA